MLRAGCEAGPANSLPEGAYADEVSALDAGVEFDFLAGIMLNSSDGPVW